MWQWENNMTEQLYRIRRHLHQFPELSFQEHRTCAYIIEQLKAWEIPYKQFGATGVIVDIYGESGKGLHLALRADIDALPIQEETALPFASRQPGIMHACGHDGHTTILLGAVYHLWKHRSQLSGMVRCIFQPGEEADGAAKQMIEQGVLRNPNIDTVVALHLWPYLPFGTVGIKSEAMTASCDDFVMTVHGKSGHGARPHQAVDAIAIAAEVVRALQFLATKRCDPVEPVVIHVGRIQAGTANNIVADQARLEGTIRTTTQHLREQVKQDFFTFVTHVVESFGGKVSIQYADGIPPVVNDEHVCNVLAQSIRKMIGTDAVYTLKSPSMGADDFGYFAQEVAGAYFRLGIRKEDTNTYDLHHPKFQFDEAILPVGAKILTQFAFDWLTEGVEIT